MVRTISAKLKAGLLIRKSFDLPKETIKTLDKGAAAAGMQLKPYIEHLLNEVAKNLEQ